MVNAGDSDYRKHHSETNILFQSQTTIFKLRFQLLLLTGLQASLGSQGRLIGRVNRFLRGLVVPVLCAGPQIQGVALVRVVGREVTASQERYDKSVGAFQLKKEWY